MEYRKKKIFLMVFIFVILIVGVFSVVKVNFFSEIDIMEPLKVIMRKSNNKSNETKYAMATTKSVSTTNKVLTTTSSVLDEELSVDINDVFDIPYENAPLFIDDGSIIYDGMTMTELTNKLNKSLNSYLKNTGYFFAKYTRNTGLDPYLSVAIVLLETGCKWTCSSLTVKCNNIGGLKGGPSCNGGSYKKYDSLEEGINGYLNIIYNNYYLKGMTDPYSMASTYASSNVWAEKVTTYMNEIKAK